MALSQAQQDQLAVAVRAALPRFNTNVACAAQASSCVKVPPLPFVCMAHRPSSVNTP